MRVSTKEADVLSACLEYLSLHGIFAWRSNNTGVYDAARHCYRSFRGLKGMSDILGIIPRVSEHQGQVSMQGVFLAIEVKSATGRVSADQAWFLEEVRRRGGIALCVRSVQELHEVLTAENRIDSQAKAG